MKNKRQIVNSTMVNFDYNSGIIEYQLLFTSFANYLNSEEVNEMPSKMQVAHFLESFLRKQDIQDSLTITDINGLMDLEYIQTNINNINMYKNIFLLIYEELSSNDKEISKFILKIIENVSSILVQSFSLNDEIIENDFNEQIENIPINSEENLTNSSPDCFNCDKKFICTKDTRDEKLIEQLKEEDKQKFSELTKDIKNFYQEDNNIPLEIYQKDNIENILSIKNTNKEYLKEYLLRKNLIPYECNICGLTSWQNNPLILKLDILDESKHTLDNYRFLCPNCYSQVSS